MKKLSKLIAFVLTTTFLILMFMIYRLNLIPIKYFLAIGGVLLLFVFGLDFKLIRKKTGLFSRVVFSLFSLILIAGLIYGLTYINATYNFMNSILSKGYEIKNYAVVVNKSSGYSKIGDLNNKNIGYLKTDDYYNKAKKRIKKDIKYNEVSYSDIGNFATSVVSDDKSAIVLEKEYYNLLKEEYDSLTNTKIIKTYKIIVKKSNKKKTKDVSEPFVMYISGIDTYGNISSVSRSDVNIIAVVNPTTEKILLVSIPRDYYVQLHGTTGVKDKLTHAGIYGIDMSVNTLKDLLDEDIDYYLRLNFSTLTKSIDLIGGIDVYSDKTFTSYVNKNITITEGMNHMNGEEALAFARERHAYSTGDRHRGENQQAIITAMINKLADVSNITKYKDILSSLDGTFETSMSYEELTNLFKLQIDKKINWDISSISLDGSGSMQKTYSMGNRNLYVMIPNEASVSDAKIKIDEYMKK